MTYISVKSVCISGLLTLICISNISNPCVAVDHGIFLKYKILLCLKLSYTCVNYGLQLYLSLLWQSRLCFCASLSVCLFVFLNLLYGEGLAKR